MRTLLALASLTLLVGAGVGCGDDTTTPVADLAVGADMSAIPHDMMTLSCAQILNCAANATSTAAAAACITEGKTSSQGLFQAVFVCAAGACGPTDGGGTGMCTGLTDTQPACQNCIKGVITSGVTGGGACGTQVQACTSDT
jgi:hypothetical protein